VYRFKLYGTLVAPKKQKPKQIKNKNKNKKQKTTKEKKQKKTQSIAVFIENVDTTHVNVISY